MGPENAKPDDQFSADEMVRIRGRIHNMADKVHGHEIFLENHRVEIQRINEAMRELRATSVNQSQFMGIVADILELRTNSATKTELTNATALHTLKLDALVTAINGLKEAQKLESDERKAGQKKTDEIFGRIVWIVITTVLMAILGLVLVNRSAIGKAVSNIRIIPDIVAFAPRR